MATIWIYWDLPLGGGGEGDVYLGRILDTQSLCAVKIPTLLNPRAARQQLIAECDRHLRANGSGVVELLAWNLDAPRPFLVLELASGTLADEIGNLRRSGRVLHPVDALIRIDDVLTSLAKIHSRGLIHRDIKPANLLKVGRHLKIGDFGLGRTLDRPYALQTRMLVGTREYAAPEQLFGWPVDHRADLYAIGVVLYEMLAGVRPEPFADYRPVSIRYNNIIPGLDALMACLLSPDPNNRPSSANHTQRYVRILIQEYKNLRRQWYFLGFHGASPF